MNNVLFLYLLRSVVTLTLAVTPIQKIITLLMERGYRRIVRRYPNSKIRVTKTRYFYATKFRGLVKYIQEYLRGF